MIATAEHLWKHDRAIFERLKDDVARPPFVLGLRFEEAWDSLDEPAAWIWVTIDADNRPGGEGTKILHNYIQELREHLYKNDFLIRAIPRIEARTAKIDGRERVAGH